MGSKKLKRKKIQDKKIVKHIKLYKIKGKKYKTFKRLKKVREKPLQQNKISSSRIFNKYKYSRSSIDNKNMSHIKHFAQLREHYFSYLQQIVCENCVLCSSHLKETTLENISLKLEQHALLASLRADIYEKSILEVINDIKKSTEEKQINEKVKQFLPETTFQNVHQVKTEKSPSIEITSEILPLSNKADGEVNDAEGSNFVNNFNNDSVNQDLNNKYYYMCNQNQTDLRNNVENCTSVESFTNYLCSEMSQSSQTNLNNLGSLLKSTITPQPSGLIQIDESNAVTQTDIQETEADHFLENIQLPQQPISVELSPYSKEKTNKCISEEKERAYIAQILEGKESSDDDDNNKFDSSSDNENESKENLNDINLLSRLERMKEIFGVEDEENNLIMTKDKPKTTSKVLSQTNSRNRRPSIWRHEKIIQLYKYSMIASEMILEKQIRNKKLFLQLFGSDSDDEHELENRSEEKFRTACKERISPWIVKHLMPFYYDKKIIGRNTFKSLGHHISECIVSKILYPDEWCVKNFVSKFFPPKKKYFCAEDVTTFEYE